MKMLDLLHCKSLQGADLIVKIKNPELPVTGINILEATDIERWAKPGMVILTSYFALQNQSEAELEIFFDKLKQFHIACIILKIERLVKEIPEQFIRLCEAHAIPLIRIAGDTKYEDIIVEVLTFILGIREQRLALHYKVSKISSEMTLQMLSIHEILERFRQFLGMDLTLVGQGKRAPISTNRQLAKFTLGERVDLFSSEYMTFGYKRGLCANGQKQNQKCSSVVLVDFSINIGNSETLAIHERQKRKVNEDDIVVVENLVRCLQLNLLREYSGKQRIMWNINTLVNDLLRGLITDAEEFSAACTALGIARDGYCQVLTLNYADIDEEEPITLYEIKNRLRPEIQKFDRRMVYYTTPRYDQYILPFDKQPSACFDIIKIKSLIDFVINGEEFASRMSYSGGVSEVFPVSAISAAAAQSKAVADFLSHNNFSNNIREYKNLGLFKLFLGKECGKMVDFLPEEIIRLKTETPELFTTLCVFLKYNRNYTQTAEKLFLHPKTVKYRIEKITRKYQLDLENIHFVTMILAAIEIMEYQVNNSER